ncbi:efflux transporter outer membrane subunit [Roseateles koreensis]|uniref:Efflux transporter outer membrane subunit n=1 Tax=Roseateles koreensis TaxID=2987526 RepID=A0ABT5KLL4_9BURK|nr:efflux transporter outer membrane subunit [Roseateles koreensis]MDC8783799.1 efflux transporter outer membrane subunit [Roseateles koreensis]
MHHFKQTVCRGLTPVALSILGLILAACSTQPTVTARPVEPPAVFKEAQLWKPAAATQPRDKAAVVPADWWQLFQDPVLNDLESQLLVGNENLKSLASQVASAQALLQASQAALWPSLNLTAGGTRAGSPPSGSAESRTTANTVSVGTSASWELDLWGRYRSAARVADIKLQASQDDLVAARLSAQATLAQTYLALRAAEAQLAVQMQTESAYQRMLALTQARLDAGVVSQTDVLQAQIQLRTVQTQIEENRAQRAQFEHAIAVLLGRAPTQLTLASTGALPQLPTVPEVLPARLLERRPDIASAERAVAAAFAQIGVADAAFYPDISLSASASYRSASLGQVFNASSLLWSLGPSAVLAVFDSGARQLASSQARSAAEQAVSSYRQTVLQAFQEVEDNLVLLQRLGAELNLQNDALSAARRNLEITQSQYQAGTVSYLNVSTAQSTALTAESSVVTLRNRQLAAANVLLKNLGGRWQAEGG